MPAHYSIRDLEELSGIKAHTIRIWEKRYGLIRPGRTDTNIRYYDNEDLRKILNVSLLVKSGYRISAVCGMSEKQVSEAVVSLSPSEEGAGDRFLLSLIDLDEGRFHRTFAELTEQLGFEQTIVRVVFPFFQRVGLMWQLGTVNPAQEHFFSNLIRNKLIVETEALPWPEEGPEVVLLLPEHEWHELGLLFYAGCFRRRGYRPVYLGQAVPTESLDRVLASRTPALIVTGATTAFPDFDEWALEICRHGVPVYFTGPVPAGRALPGNGFGMDHLRALLDRGPAPRG